MLKILHQQTNDPYFNIATEEYLLRNKDDDFFIIYRNNPSIIVGKHQNTNAEINHRFVEGMKIPVVRRLSGGGTVYHDLGNINFCFIMNGAEGQLVDFKKYTEPIIDILQGLGVEAKVGGKNDIRVGDKKISGNAEHIYRNRVLHRGTLLFNSDLDKLNDAISVDLSKYHDSAVKSIRSSVANIADFLPVPMNIDFFVDMLIGYILNFFPQSEDYMLSEYDSSAIVGLVNSKYSTWEWTYGYSPLYEINSGIQTSQGELAVKLKVNKGVIEEVSLGTDVIAHPSIEKLKLLLVGKEHSHNNIVEAIADKEIGDFFQNHLSVKLIPEYFY